MREGLTSPKGYFPAKRFIKIVSFFLIMLSFTLSAQAGGVKEQFLSRPDQASSPAEKSEKGFPAVKQENGSTDLPSADKVEPTPVYLPQGMVSEQAVITASPAAMQNAPLGITYESNGSASRAIDKNLTFFKDRIKERFALWLERSARYVEIMKEVLKAKGLPEDLVFLPIVESGFNPNAYSKAAAVGPWQFISATAQRYGLVVDWWRDERRDPVKSTNAAASYLRDLYGMFGSWKLALAAYNAGEGSIMRALKKTGADDYWTLMDTKHLHSETRDYVPKYIAASMIASAPEEYGFSNLVYHKPMSYDEVTLTSPVDVDVIARCAETSVEEIRGLNPELKRWSTPPNVSRYTVRLPEGTKGIFSENLMRIPKEERFTVESYTVRKGDSLRKISGKTGVPENAILAMNSISGKRIPAGTVLNLPPMEKFRVDRDDQRIVKVSRKENTKAQAVKVSGKKRHSGGKAHKAEVRKGSRRSVQGSKKNLTTRVSHKAKPAKTKAKAKTKTA
ncbi:MAG: transglycosylase SLT domain-containing protein [Nitrospirales bacterium]|nr:transglycosylase SLT domain-containing protein [Nitrospirales bacterium]